MIKSTGLILAFAVIATAMLFAAPSFADAVLNNPPMLPPGVTITPVGDPLIPAPGFIPAVWAPLWNFVSTASFLFWLMSQARAKFAILGQLGWLTQLGDVIAAGNWGHAANKDG